MHPAICAVTAEALAEAAAAGSRVGVVEAALILEVGQRAQYDCLVVVTAPLEVQVARLRDSRGLSEAEARQRIAAQWPAEAKVAVADFVIENGGERDATAAQVDAVWEALTRGERAAKKA